MKRLSILALFLAVTLAGCNPPPLVGPPDDGNIRIGRPAPEIVATTVDGKVFRLSELKGKIVVLDFWATWCGPCVKAMPAMKALQEKYKDQPFVIVGISLDHNRKKLTDYIEAEKIGWMQIHDNDADGSGGAIAARWKVDSIPRIYVLDQDGIVRYVPFGEAQIERAVKNLLSDLATRS